MSLYIRDTRVGDYHVVVWARPNKNRLVIDIIYDDKFATASIVFMYDDGTIFWRRYGIYSNAKYVGVERIIR